MTPSSLPAACDQPTAASSAVALDGPISSTLVPAPRQVAARELASSLSASTTLPLGDSSLCVAMMTSL